MPSGRVYLWWSRSQEGCISHGCSASRRLVPFLVELQQSTHSGGVVFWWSCPFKSFLGSILPALIGASCLGRFDVSRPSTSCLGAVVLMCCLSFCCPMDRWISSFGTARCVSFWFNVTQALFVVLLHQLVRVLCFCVGSC